ncbi:methylamine utilization protein MauE [Streptomyces sp. KM273126]|uniref:MauE/DoxX family redox-associated membrane protein n=1 Tax=Streptomyces sp. KM273126 TaxID=2545247 RepID=UPI001404EC02|nr:MauE/DoxX family redox-associated membrane protein [Streptomyces sp. KM273126]MBA2813239.1 methylamine utilization protein MauE [Streptomyces sp. KM273126]
MHFMDLVVWASQGCLLLVFALSAHGKARDGRAFEEFTESVRAFAPAFAGHARSVAALVLTGEAAAVVTLAVPATVPLGLALSAVLLTAFTVAIAARPRTGDGVPCRCFGAASAQPRTVLLLRNGALLAVTGGGITAAAVGGPGHAATPAAAALALCAGGVLGLLAATLDDLVGLFRPLT